MRTLLALLERHAPLTFTRIDPASFALNRPLDLLQGAVTPTVRRAYAEVAEQRFVLALGDTHVTHDPLTGQGANAAARSAWLLGQLIVDAFTHDEPIDEIFCHQAEQQIWNDLQPVTAWSNAMLQPPPPHVVELLVAASQHQTVADAFADFFNTPHHTWEIFSSPPRMNTFLQHYGWTPTALLMQV